MTSSKNKLDLDELLDSFGGISRFQIFAMASSIYLMFSTAIMMQLLIFISAIPEHRCAIPFLDNSDSNWTENEIKNYTIPYDKTRNRYDSCLRYDINFTSCQDISCIKSTDDVIPCDKGYHYSTDVYGETTVSQWNLVCDRAPLDSLATSLFYFGFFIGAALFGPISDWFGRKKSLLLFGFFSLVTGVGVSFLPSYEWFVIIRILHGVSVIASTMAVITYANEMVTPKHRIYYMLFNNLLGSGLSHTVMVGFAFALKDWRQLELLCGLLPAPFFLLYFFIPESPRWLLVVDKPEEAKKVISKIASSHKKELNLYEWEQVVAVEKEKHIKGLEKRYSALDLFKSPRMKIVTCMDCFIWFSAGLVVYGLTLNVGNLAGDVYINATIVGLMEMVGALCLLIVPRVGKRIYTSASLLICALLCFASTACNQLAFGNQAIETAGVALALLGKVLASSGFLANYSLTIDIFPTVVRGTGVSVGSMSARLGNIVLPWAIELQFLVPWLTQVIFGTLSFLAFILTLFLPEMRDAPTLTSLSEAEEFYAKNMKLFNKFRRSKNYNKMSELNNNEYEVTKF